MIANSKEQGKRWLTLNCRCHYRILSPINALTKLWTPIRHSRTRPCRMRQCENRPAPFLRVRTQSQALFVGSGWKSMRDLPPLAPSIPRFNRLRAVGLTTRQCSPYAASPKVARPLCRPGHPALRRMSPTGLLHLGFLEIRHLLPNQTSLPGRTDNLPGRDFHPLDTQH